MGRAMPKNIPQRSSGMETTLLGFVGGTFVTVLITTYLLPIVSDGLQGLGLLIAGAAIACVLFIVIIVAFKNALAELLPVSWTVT
jgi:hypothetical protein